MPAWFESSPDHGPGRVVRVSTPGPASANQGGGPAGATDLGPFAPALDSNQQPSDAAPNALRD